MVKEFLKNKTAITIFKIIISILFLVIVLVKIDFKIIFEINYILLFFLLGFVNLLTILIIQAYRWKIVLKEIYSYSISWKELFKIVSIGQFFSFITPSRIGDVFKAKYITKDLGKLRAVSSVLIDRIVEFIVLLIIALIGILYFSGTIINILIIDVVSFFYIGLVLVVVIIGSVIFLKRQFKNQYNKIKKELETIIKNKKTVLKIGIISVLVWVLSFSEMHLAALTIGLNTSMIDMIMITAVITVIMLLPITIAGVGLRELTGTTLLTIIGVTASQGLLIVWIVFITLTLFPALLGYIFYITYKENVPKIKEVQ